MRRDRDNGPRGHFCHNSDREYIVMRVLVRNGYTTARSGHRVRGYVRYKCSYRADTANRNMVSRATANVIQAKVYAFLSFSPPIFHFGNESLKHCHYYCFSRFLCHF